ncbi:MAG: peptide deformylase [Bacteroidota bacterium]
MILPIYAYGHPVLKRVAKDIEKDYPELEKLIADMWDTMYNAQGVGLAAPQIGKGIRLFLVDSVQAMEEGKEADGIKQVFINAQKIEESGKEWAYEEGCLSIPDVRGDVRRQETLILRYLDENFEEHTTTFTGINARVVQHEYDHIEGLLFTEKLKPIKKRLVKRKLENIRKGKVSADYKMKFVTSNR